MGRPLAATLAGLSLVLAAAACGNDPAARSPTGSQGASTDEAAPAPVPAGIVALTEEGEVLVIDRRTKEARTIATFPPRDDPQVEAGSFRAVDVTALPDGRLLLATCCEPAAGHMYALSPEGEGVEDQDLFAEDAGADARSGRVASGELVGLVLRSLADLAKPAATVALAPDQIGVAPEDISWSPAGDRILFTIGGRLGVVSPSAGSLAEATYVDASAGSHWSGAAYTTDGAVAVEQGGDPLHPSGPSRLLRVDPGTGEWSELVPTTGRITDLAVDPSGSYLLWVEDGTLRWLAGRESVTLPGSFIAAGWWSEPV